MDDPTCCSWSRFFSKSSPVSLGPCQIMEGFSKKHFYPVKWLLTMVLIQNYWKVGPLLKPVCCIIVNQSEKQQLQRLQWQQWLPQQKQASSRYKKQPLRFMYLITMNSTPKRCTIRSVFDLETIPIFHPHYHTHSGNTSRPVNLAVVC